MRPASVSRRVPNESIRAAGPGLRSHLVLFTGLSLLTAAQFILPGQPVAFRNPALAVAVSSTATLAGFLTLVLGLWHFRVTGAALSLFVALAFGMLGLGNLFLGVLLPVLQPPASGGPQELTVYLFLLMSAAAGGFLIAAFVGADKLVLTRGAESAQAAIGVMMVVGLAIVAILQLGGPLPALFSVETRALIAGGGPLVDFLPGQRPVLLLASTAIAMMLASAWLGLTSLSALTKSARVSWLAVSIGLLFFGQLYSVAFPPIPEYVSIGDACRLAAYVVLLASFVSEAVHDVGTRAADTERLRISRELHDGLAQQLALLNLTLRRQSNGSSNGQFETAKRLAEAALLEARQAILALRRQTSSWEEMVNTLSSLCEEFGQNHDVEVQFAHRGQANGIGAQAELDVVRIVNEALSNAVRHGRATRAAVSITAKGADIEVQVQDDGAGFDATFPPGNDSVGLQSISERLESRGGALRIESEPGAGTTLTARLPVDRTVT